MKGIKNKQKGLWYVPISTKTGHEQTIIQNEQQEENSAYHTSILAETIQFLHQCLFSPMVDTLCKAIDNDQLIGFPTLTSASVHKYLPPSITTTKGHMNQTRKGLRSMIKQE
jgi:hypothetical protein